MAIAILSEHVLLLVMDEENVERMVANDPWEFDVANAPSSKKKQAIQHVIVAYAKKDEIPMLLALRDERGLEAVVRYLYRGFQLTDTDAKRQTPYEKI